MYFFRRFTLLLIVWAAVFSTSSPASTPQGGADQPRRLQVSLFNDAGVDSATLAEAQSRASAIFSHSGIEVDWLVCGPADPNDFLPRRTACSALVWPSHLSVRIRPRAVSVSAETFGQAFVNTEGEGLYCNVYYQNLARSSGHRDLSDGEMLGYVLAHELGHLLLGTNSHSASGLMQPRWDSSTLRPDALSSLRFTPSQSAVLRSRLAPPCPTPANILFSLSARL
jgi:hypothetical protein